MTRQEEIREFVEAVACLRDDYDSSAYPIAKWLDEMRSMEASILNEDDLTYLYDWLQEEIDEYDGNDSTQDHADEAKRLKNWLGSRLDNRAIPFV